MKPDEGSPPPAGQDVFPALAKFVKTVEFDEALESGLLEALKRFEECMSTNRGPFLCGERVTLPDFSLAPKLFHMDVALKTFRPDTHDKVKANFPKVNEYMAVMFQTPAFNETKYPEEYVVFGWTQARGGAH